ncbi:tyrosine-type recombinase/integrase [Cellulomonas alba]|uniref:Site-specific integrase n=1 Tax=Cellulomonas alba TaxID=3053467 RepID=A0ABT7SBV0_9CELL|nr:site-specific integrase [Cellulomonas alba]MDM7853658.1 site-specific integrase [Cellulomonas alba]
MNATTLHAVTAKEAHRLAKTVARRADALGRFRGRYRHNKESSRAMTGALRRLAMRFSDGQHDETSFPWELLVDRDLAQLMWSTVAAGVSAATATRDASALRVMLQCCYRAGLLTYEQYRDAITFEAKGGLPRRPAGTYLTTAELGAVLEACMTGPGNDATGVRDAALIAFLAGSGPRRNEVVNVDLADLDLPELKAWLGTTKGGAPRDAWLHPAAADYLDRWLEIRGGQPGPLFVPLSRTGRPLVGHGPLSSHQVWKIVRTRGEQAGITGLAPHDMRRFLISHLLPTTDITLVARIVGHARVSTTAKYDRRPQEAQRLAIASLDLPAPDPTAVQCLEELKRLSRELGLALGGSVVVSRLPRVSNGAASARVTVSGGPDDEVREFELTAPDLQGLADRLAITVDYVRGLEQNDVATYRSLFFAGVDIDELRELTADLLR